MATGPGRTSIRWPTTTKWDPTISRSWGFRSSPVASSRVALFLAAIGLYAVMSYAVSQSTRELGLHMALGARGSDLLRLVMSRGLILTIGGLLVGAAAALAVTRLLGNRLYEVSPYDPLAF